MCDQAMKHSANQMKVNSSTLYPITTLESLRLMPTTDSDLTMSSGGTQPAEEDPTPSCNKGGRIG